MFSTWSGHLPSQPRSASEKCCERRSAAELSTSHVSSRPTTLSYMEQMYYVLVLRKSLIKTYDSRKHKTAFQLSEVRDPPRTHLCSAHTPLLCHWRVAQQPGHIPEQLFYVLEVSLRFVNNYDSYIHFHVELISNRLCPQCPTPTT